MSIAGAGAGVQWVVHVPDGVSSAWPELQGPYIKNVAAAAGVPEDWVTVLEAPNATFTVATEAGHQTAASAQEHVHHYGLRICCQLALRPPSPSCKGRNS